VRRACLVLVLVVLGLYVLAAGNLYLAQDAIVPIELGRRLFAAFPGSREFLEVPGAGHNDLSFEPGAEVGGRVRGFLLGQ
jgi:pimeloyl-ACP methyl ester carboxylesterase